MSVYVTNLEALYLLYLLHYALLATFVGICLLFENVSSLSQNHLCKVIYNGNEVGIDWIELIGSKCGSLLRQLRWKIIVDGKLFHYKVWIKQMVNNRNSLMPYVPVWVMIYFQTMLMRLFTLGIKHNDSNFYCYF